MSTAVFCDKCGRVFPVEKIVRTQLRTKRHSECECWSNHDLCEECLEKIEKAFILKENEKEEN